MVAMSLTIASAKRFLMGRVWRNHNEINVNFKGISTNDEMDSAFYKGAGWGRGKNKNRNQELSLVFM